MKRGSAGRVLGTRGFRPVAGGEGGGVMHILRSVNFFCLIKITTLQLGMVEHPKVRQNCHKIENH